MNYGLYLSASGVLSGLYRQDVYANNLANVQTVGFKADRPTVRQREPEATEGRHPSAFHQQLLDKLGGGVLAGEQRVSLEAGAAQATHNPLDVALLEPDTFFNVQVSDPETGAAAVRLSRDGRFSRNAEGFLVAASTGFPVLDAGDRPIELNGDQPVQINAQGQVIQAGQAIAQLQISTVNDPSRLAKQGRNLLWARDGTDMRQPAVMATLAPEHVEASTVDPIRALMELTAATKDVANNGNMIKYHDEMMSRAVNSLGRVS